MQLITHSEMGQNRIRAVFRIERVDKKRVITNAILDGLDYLCKDLFCGIHKNLVEIFLVTNLIQHARQRLYPHELILHEDDIAKTKEILEVTKSDRCIHESVSSTPDISPEVISRAKQKKRNHTSPTTVTITIHDPRRRMCEGERLESSISKPPDHKRQDSQ